MRFFALIVLALISIWGVYAQQKIPQDSVTSLKDTIRLGEVSVETTHKRKITGLLSGDITLNVEALNSVPALTGTLDVLKILELTPSVRTAGDGNTNIYVRGGDAGQNLILYNDVPSYTPGHVLGLFPLFNPDHIYSLQLSKSGVNARHGGFLTSVIDIESKTTIPEKNSIKGNAGLLASHISMDIPINKDWGISVSGRKTYLELLMEPIMSALGGGESDLSYGFWDSNLTILGRVNRNNFLQIDAMLGGDNLSIKDEEIMINGKMKWKNYLTSAKLTTGFRNNSELEQILLFSHFNNNLYAKQGGMYINLDSEIETIGYKSKYSGYFKEIPFDIGVSYGYNSINPHNLSMINSGITMNSVQEDNIYAHDFSVFMTAKLNPVKGFRVEPGIRYNLFHSKLSLLKQRKTFQNIDLRLYLQYSLKPNIYIRGGYSHNNQYINKLTPSNVGLPTDFWVAATRQVKPQEGDEVSIGYYHSLNEGDWEFSADAYYREMNNVTEFDYNFTESDNISYLEKILYGKGQAYGLEFMIKKNYGKLTGWLSYSLGKADRKFRDINEGKRFPAKFDRTHDLSLSLNYKLNKRWDASFTYVFATGSTYTQPSSWYFINNMPVKEYTEHNNARMPNYIRADIGVNYWFSPRSGLNFSLYNMFARSNPIYVFMVIKERDGLIETSIKKKKLYTLIPSISWNFKF